MADKKAQVVVTFFILLGQLSVFIYGSDFFPFSAYPMYSKIFEPSKLISYDLQGFDKNAQPVQINLNNYLKPFWRASFFEATLFVKNEEKIRNKLKAILGLYNTRSPASLQLSKIEFYRIEESFQSYKDFKFNQNSNRDLQKILIVTATNEKL